MSGQYWISTFRASKRVRNGLFLSIISMSKTTTHDVIVIGGGPAGSSAATWLSRGGHRVLLLEREKFPREHVGESLLPFCYPLLQDLGVIDQLKKNFVRKPGVRFIDRDGNVSTTWCFDHVIKDETYLSFQVIRGEFDHILLKNAAKNGAEVREETTVTSADITSAPDQVTVTSLDSTGRENAYRPFLGRCEWSRGFHWSQERLAQSEGGTRSDRDMVPLGRRQVNRWLGGRALYHHLYGRGAERLDLGLPSW